MLEEKAFPEKFGPCIEKKCSWCCDPVKVKRGFPEKMIPRDIEGYPIWEKRDEYCIPMTKSDYLRLDVYDCLKFDKTSGRCLIYEERPRICRNSSCCSPDSDRTIDEQYQATVGEKLEYIKPKKNL